jgi:hypothetical protein
MLAPEIRGRGRPGRAPVPPEQSKEESARIHPLRAARDTPRCVKDRTNAGDSRRESGLARPTLDRQNWGGWIPFQSGARRPSRKNDGKRRSLPPSDTARLAREPRGGVKVCTDVPPRGAAIAPWERECVLVQCRGAPRRSLRERVRAAGHGPKKMCGTTGSVVMGDQTQAREVRRSRRVRRGPRRSRRRCPRSDSGS